MVNWDISLSSTLKHSKTHQTLKPHQQIHVDAEEQQFSSELSLDDDSLHSSSMAEPSHPEKTLISQSMFQLCASSQLVYHYKPNENFGPLVRLPLCSTIPHKQEAQILELLLSTSHLRPRGNISLVWNRGLKLRGAASHLNCKNTGC